MAFVCVEHWVTYLRLWERMQMKEDCKLVPCFEFAEKLCVDGGRHITVFVEKYSNACVNASTSLVS